MNSSNWGKSEEDFIGVCYPSLFVTYSLNYSLNSLNLTIAKTIYFTNQTNTVLPHMYFVFIMIYC